MLIPSYLYAHMRNLLIILSCTLALTACKGWQESVDINADTHSKEQIVFHQFNASHHSGIINIDEIERVLRDGKIKEVFNQADLLDHPVEVIFLDRSSTRLKSMFIEHPLIREYEYSDQDGELSRVTSFEDSAIFTLRYNHIENFKYIIFASETMDSLTINYKLKISK